MSPSRARRLCAGCVLVVAQVCGAVQAAVYVVQGRGTPEDPARILVFASDAIGDTPPIRIISGANTGLVSPSGLAVDDLNGELYVSDCNFPVSGSVSVFPLGAHGDVAPLRRLTFADSDFHCMRSVSIDPVRDELWVPWFDPFSSQSAIGVFARTVSGSSTPLRTIAGAATLLKNVGPSLFDPVHEEWLGLVHLSDGSVNVLTFPFDADGNVAPSRRLGGEQTGIINWSTSLAYDSDHDELLVGTQVVGRGFAAFGRTGSGDVPPLREVVGPDTGLEWLTSLVYDPRNARVVSMDGFPYRLDPFDVPALKAFRHGDAGNVPAQVTIAGPSTLLKDPIAMAIDAEGGFSATGPQVFMTSATFDAAAGDPTSFAHEDFEFANLGVGQVRLCGDPLDSASNDACAMPGDIAAGFALRSSSGKATALFGAGYDSNTSTAAGVPFGGEATVLEFGTGVLAVGLDLHVAAGTAQQQRGVLISIYDASGRLVDQSSPRLFEPAGSGFLGVVAATGPTRAIRRIELRSATGSGIVLIDNLRFRGTPETIFRNGFDD